MVILAFNKLIEVTSTILLAGGLLWFGYQVMGRIDRFLATKPIPSEEHSPKVLMYDPKHQINDVTQHLEMKADEVVILSIADVQTQTTYQYVLAFGDQDLDNLLLCIQAKQKVPTCKTFALCNDTHHEKLFQHDLIDHYYTSLPHPSQLIHHLKETSL